MEAPFKELPHAKSQHKHPHLWVTGLNLLHRVDPTRSLRARLTLCFGAVTLSLSVVLLTVVIIFSRERLQAENGLSLAEIATSTAEIVDRSMYERLREVTNLAGLAIFTSDNCSYDERRTTLETARSSYTYYSWLAFVSPQGRVLVATQGILEGVNVSARPVFQNGKKGPWAGDVHYALLLQSLLANTSTEPLRFLDFSAPVYDSQNNLIGVICAHLNWVWAREIQSSALALDKSRSRGLEFFIFTADSRMLLGNPNFQNDTDTVLNLPWVPEFYNSTSNSKFMAVSEWPTEKNISIIHHKKLVIGMARCTGYSSYKPLPWMLVFTMSAKEANQVVSSLQDKIIVCGVVFWVVFSFLGWCVADQIARPLVKSSSVAERLLSQESKRHSGDPLPKTAPGSLDAEIDIPWFLKDEVYTMCKSTHLLIHTVEELRLMTSMLEQRVEERTLVLKEEIKCRQQLQNSAEEARRRAESAEIGKSRFLANMSHEIRTPMNGILGTIQLVLDTKLSTDQLDYVLTMKHSADSLLCIINDILLFSKLEANQFHLNTSTFRMEHLMEGVGGLLSSLVNSKQIGLYFLIEQDKVPPVLVGDTDRLQQVLVNMVGNSVKFTATPGEVLVVCSRSCSTCYLRQIFGTDENSAFVRGGGSHSCSHTQEGERDNESDEAITLNIEVRDSGCGMSVKQMSQLFTPFYQADTSTTRAAGGTGLGLAICKQLVELFGGQITVSSREGQGTAFCFSIKLRSTPSRVSLSLSHEFLPRISTKSLLQSSNIAPRDPARVLVASGSPWFSGIANSFFSTIGFTKHAVFEYTNFSDLDQNLAQFCGMSYHAVMLFCSDVEDIVQKSQLAMNHSHGAHVIVVCPSITQPLRKQLTSFGLRHLNLPLSEAKLRRFLASLLFSSDMEEAKSPRDGARPTTPRRPPTPKEGEKPTTPKDGAIAPNLIARPSTPKAGPDSPKHIFAPNKSERNVHVLAVEDNATNMKILQKYLEKIGVVITTARDGVEAVAAIQKGGVGHFDLILMDLHMPNMDGIQATSEIRKWEQALNLSEEQRVTIIALTADVMPGISEQCTSAGMDGYLSKPIDYSLLSSVIKRAKEDLDNCTI